MPETCAAIVIAAKHGELIKVRDYSGITDTVGALRCKFEFRTNDWDNATMTAVFCKGNMATNPEIVDGAIGVLLDSIDECAVPAEVLTRDAKYFSVGVWGVTTAGFRIVSKWLVFRIEDGCYVDATDPIEITPTLFEQIMATLASKAPIEHEHNDIYYTKTEIDDIIVTGVPGAGGGVKETDPTVPSWAKQPNKPKYTASEVGALPASTKIPSATSDLTNNSGFITKDVSNLANYHTKSEVYTKTEVDNKGFLTQHQDLSSYAKKVDLTNYRKLDVAVPSEDVSYINNKLADETNTVKGALDEAVGFVMGTVAPSLHTHDNDSVLNNLGESNGKLTYNGEDVGGSGDEYTAGDLIEIKDGVIRSTLGDFLDEEPVEEINEIFSFDEIKMEVKQDNPDYPIAYHYFFEDENVLSKLPDSSKKFTIEFVKSDGSKKTFDVDLEGEEWEDGSYYESYLNCEDVEVGKSTYFIKIDENSDAIYVCIDCTWGEEPYTFMCLITFEDYTDFSLKMGYKEIVIKGNYVKLPNEALNLDPAPIENSENLVTSAGIYDAINKINNKIQNITAEDIGALPNNTVIPSKTSVLYNDAEFTTLDNVLAELSNQEYVKKEWVNLQLHKKQDSLIIDSEPTENSNNVITSGAVYAALQNVGGSYELTEEDKNEIKDAVLAALPNAEEVDF